MATIKETPFSSIGKRIYPENFGLTEMAQLNKWHGAVDKCLHDINYTGVMKGNRLHFEMEQRKTAIKIGYAVKNVML